MLARFRSPLVGLGLLGGLGLAYGADCGPRLKSLVVSTRNGIKAVADVTVLPLWRTVFGPVSMVRRAYPPVNESTSFAGRYLWKPFRVSLGWRETPHDILYKYVMPILRTATPLRFGRTNRLVYGEVGVLFERLFRDPNWIFDPAINARANARDWEVIQKYKLTGELEEFRAEMREHSQTYRAHRHLRTATDLLVLAGTTQAVVHALEVEENAHSLAEFRELPIGPHEVQLLSETVPFPHLAVRLGSDVFSYGTESLSRTKLADYISTFVPPAAKVEEGKRNSSARALGNFLSGAYKATGWGDQPRSVQVASIYLKPDEYLRLRRALELKVGNHYDNTTFVNDCATMIDRAITQATNGEVSFSFLVDASPGQMILATQFLRRFHPDRFGPVQLILVGEPDKKGYHVARNALINAWEAKLFSVNFSFDKLYRLVEEAKHLNKPWEAMDPAVVQVRDEEARKAALERIREDLSLAFITLNLPASEVSLNDINSIENRLNQEEENLESERREAENSPSTDAVTLLSFGFRESLLKEIRERAAAYRSAI